MLRKFDLFDISRLNRLKKGLFNHGIGPRDLGALDIFNSISKYRLRDILPDLNLHMYRIIRPLDYGRSLDSVLIKYIVLAYHGLL